jgi:hypothetical protein
MACPAHVLFQQRDKITVNWSHHQDWTSHAGPQSPSRVNTQRHPPTWLFERRIARPKSFFLYYLNVLRIILAICLSARRLHHHSVSDGLNIRDTAGGWFLGLSSRAALHFLLLYYYWYVCSQCYPVCPGKHIPPRPPLGTFPVLNLSPSSFYPLFHYTNEQAATSPSGKIPHLSHSAGARCVWLRDFCGFRRMCELKTIEQSFA